MSRRAFAFRCSSLFCILAALLLFAGLAQAQVRPGTPSFSAYDSNEIDTIDLQSFNLSLNVPIMNKSGAFPFNFSLTGGDSYVTVSTAVPPALAPGVLAFPLSGVADGILGSGGGYVLASYAPFTCANGTGTAAKWSNFTLHFADGTSHAFPVTDSAVGAWGGFPGDCPTSFTDTTIDGSGYTVSITGCSSWPSCLAQGLGFSVNSVYSRSGLKVAQVGALPTSFADPNGNSISYNWDGNGNGTQYVDTLGLPTLTEADGTQSLSTLSWTDVSGGSPQVVPTFTGYTLSSAFGCSGFADYNQSAGLPTKISFPDNTYLGLAYEATGRLTTLTLPTGGTVSYNWNPSSLTHDGLNCTYLVPTELTRTTSDGTTTYSLAFFTSGGSCTTSAACSTTFVVDPGGNQTVYSFSAAWGAAAPVSGVLTEVQHYRGNGGGATLLTTDIYCYNLVFSSCSTTSAPRASVSLPITRQVVFHQVSGMSNYSATETHFDGYGNVTYSGQYDFGGTTPSRATTIAYGTCSSCTAGTPTIGSIGSNVNDKPGWISTTQCTTSACSATHTVADSRFAYDAHGNLLVTYAWTGSQWLSNISANTYNSNGTPSTSYDLANKETTYTYASGGYSDGCSGATQYPFPTSIENVGTALTWTYTYDCTGGVVLTDADPNGTTTASTICYNTGTGCSGGTADPYWRVMQTIDPYGATVTQTYPTGSSPDTFSSSFEFNSSNSIEANTITTDGYGRPINSQSPQSPTGSNYDTLTTVYGWSGNYRQVSTSQPCSTISGGTCATVHTTKLDPLGRLYSQATTSNETLTHTPNQNDTLVQLTPPPSGENAKQVQTEFDGLGRLTYSCQVGNGSATACGGRNLNSLNGVTDAYVYSSPAAGETEVAITRGSQTRYQIYDALGRVIQSTTPEGGTTHYYYDTVASACSALSGEAHAGLLTCTVDANGTETIYSYDSMNRLTDIGTSATGSTCRRFRYDNTSGMTGTIPTGITLANQYGRVAEAETDDCTWPVTTAHQITDEWFAYDKDGRQTDLWESTPNSTQYYHSVATFFANGTVNTVQLASPSKYTMTWGVDGEGRWNTLTDTTTSQSIVTGATFYPAANPFQITLTGSTPDNDQYTVDNNTGNIKQYQFSLGSTPTTMTGALTWNMNRSLAKLAITDNFNSGGTQACNFNPTVVGGTGYDDLGRLVGVDCGSGFWGQTFGYDQYDNLSKAPAGTGRIGTTWNPGYSTTTNHYSSPATYDSDGNVTYDGVNTYSWNEYSKLKTAASGMGVANCGTSGHCATYDAFGRMVEYSIGATYHENWLTQAGMVSMSGATPLWAYWSAPEGGTAVVNANSSAYFYMHKDWVGSARLVSSVTAHTETLDQAFSPYGEAYATFGSMSAQYDQFAGTTANFFNGVMADTPNRELSNVGRWLSTDPIGSGWNQYAYATNPNSFIDPWGLGKCPPGQTYSNGHCYTNTPGVGCTDRGNNNPNCKNSPTNPGIWDDPFAFLGWLGGSEGYLYGVGNFFSAMGIEPSDAANNNPCGGMTKQLTDNVAIQSDPQGTFTATVQLTGPEGGAAFGPVSGALDVFPSTTLTIGYNGALTVSASPPIFYSIYYGAGGAYISSFTYNAFPASGTNAGFTEVNGTRAVFGIPWSSSQTPSAYLLNLLNQNPNASSLSNNLEALQTLMHAGQTGMNAYRFFAGCRNSNGG